MDISIRPEILRKRQLQAWSRGVLIVLSVVVLLILLRQLIMPAIARGEIRTAVVERGPISTEVEASGTVVPKTERVLISPVTSSIREVYLPLGSSVKKGDAILQVDSTQVELEIKRLNDELRLKDLQIAGIVQTQQQALRTLRNQEELAGIELQNQQMTLARNETLLQSNTVSKFDYESASLNVKKSEIQLRQLAEQIADTTAADNNQREQLEIEKQILLQQLVKQEQQFRDTTIRASTNGMITALLNEPGQNVAAGVELARISDMASFRIDATLSGYYLHQVSVGMPVTINLGNGTTTGTLSQVLPSVEGGTIRVQIELDDSHNLSLQPNMRVDAAILTQQRNSGIRVVNGIVFNGSGVQEIFVLQGSKAVKRQVEVGLLNSNHVEIISGLNEGDEIIISDMTDYQHLDEVAINN